MWLWPRREQAETRGVTGLARRCLAGDLHRRLLFCWITQDFELYAAFNPLADKSQAIKMCNRVCQWVRDLENEIFVYGESALSW